MKDKILLCIIGVLIGAIISTGAFYIYSTTAGECDCNNQNTAMNGGQPPEIPNDQNNQSGQPPEKPDGDNEQVSENPTDNNSQDSN